MTNTRLITYLSGLVLVASISLTGCVGLGISPTDSIADAAAPIVNEVSAAHDYQVKAGETLLTTGSLRSLMERYGDNPKKMYAIMVLGGYEVQANDLAKFIANMDQ